MGKRLMLLGGIRYLLPVIEAAHGQGYHVITADYLPGNIAHRYSDEYVNVNIVDREAVLLAAESRKIDGIMSFGVDPGVVSAAYVQHKLGLPAFGPLESVEILQNKDRFRAFLHEHGFNAPQAEAFSSCADALNRRNQFRYPVVVKPTDSAGSKGVTRVDNETQLETALEYAFRFSFSGRVIVEDFIEKQGCSSDADSFSLDGQLQFIDFNAQRFDRNAPNPHTPAAYSWPSTFTSEQKKALISDIQRLVSLLQMRTNIYNIETRIGTDGKPYIMELTPRGGGNRLSEMIRYSTGVDMIGAMARYCVGDSVPALAQTVSQGHWAEIILHSRSSGRFNRINIDSSLPADIIEQDLWVERGDHVNAFCGANDAIGTLVLKFNTAEALEAAIDNQDEWLRISVD